MEEIWEDLEDIMLEMEKDLIGNQKPMPANIRKIVDDNFWDLI